MIEEVLRYWRLCGALLPALALVAFGIWFYFLSLRRALLRMVRAPREFEMELSRYLRRRSLEENLVDYAARCDPLSQAVACGLDALRRREPPSEAFDEFQRAHLALLDRDTTILRALTSAAPLLGLLGTVIGMVTTFSAVAVGHGNTAVDVSTGVSQALITTQFGLVVAIPGIFGMARLERLFAHAKVRLGECRTHLVHLYELRVARAPGT